MKSIFLNTTLGTILLALSAFSNAGLITNTANDSFIDETTGYEWMDFGVNNQYSYNQVVNMLSTEFAGWELATESQVLAMWVNAFSGKGSSIDEVYTSGEYYNRFDSNNLNGNSVHEAVFSAMGTSEFPGYALGWFADTYGSLSFVHFYDQDDGSDRVFSHGRNVNHNGQFNNLDFRYSTMLVKTIPIPEPTTIAIFSFGILALVSSRLKR
jgi:hypothetical protein